MSRQGNCVSNSSIRRCCHLSMLRGKQGRSSYLTEQPCSQMHVVLISLSLQLRPPDSAALHKRCREAVDGQVVSESDLRESQNKELDKTVHCSGRRARCSRHEPMTYEHLSLQLQASGEGQRTYKRPHRVVEESKQHYSLLRRNW